MNMDTMDTMIWNGTRTTLEEESDHSAYVETQEDDTSYDSFLDQWSSNEGYVRDGILGVLFCGAVLATCFYLSHQYTVGERTAEAEEEQRRSEAINRKVEEVESKKKEIAKVIHGYAISMVSIVARGDENDTNTNTHTDNDTDNNNTSSQSTISTILQGNHEHEHEHDYGSTRHEEDFTEKTRFMGMIFGDADEEEDEMIDIEAGGAVEHVEEPVMRFLELDLEELEYDDDDGHEDQIIDIEAITEQPAVIAETITNNTMMQSNSTLYLSHEGKKGSSEGSENDNEGVPVPIPASILLKAADHNPCAICLEAFVPSDNIIFCSNHILTNKKGQHTGYPHCFHEECSLDYMFAHAEGVQAPCPLCRKPFLCSFANGNNNNNNNSMEEEQEEQQQVARGGREGGGGAMNLPSHPSSVSLTHHRHSSSVSFTDLMVAALAEEEEEANANTNSSEV